MSGCQGLGEGADLGGTGFIFFGGCVCVCDKNDLELDYSDGYTTL